jgi:hypothetical protein
MVTGYLNVRDGLARAINENSFTYVGEGLIEVENFISGYLLDNGYNLKSFIMQEIPGARRHLRIWFTDIEIDRGYYIEYTVFGGY